MRLLHLGVCAIIGLSLPAIHQAGAKTVRACEAEWTANKATIQSGGKTKRAFMAECRAEQAAVQAPPEGQGTPAQPQKTPPRVERRAEIPAAPAAPRTRARTRQALAAGQFATEAEAKAHCPGDTVVWANTKSKIYHYSGARRYGATKSGAYMCERETASIGIRVAKNEKRP